MRNFQRPSGARSRRRRARFARYPMALAAIAALALLAPMTAAATPASKQVAKQVQSEALGKSVLANLKGRTLYSLSVEKHGKFICTGACTATWHPLLVPAATKPKGPVALGTVERPEGKTQVTFKGRPLYTFAGDTGAGQANGEGIMDVGTWHAATIAGAAAPAPAPQPAPTPSPYPSPY
jgi:predicted lipoprotein with Yx(FWY)xxD motif